MQRCHSSGLILVSLLLALLARPGPDSLVAAEAPPTESAGWFAFAPKPDTFADGSAIDLRSLNETMAGEHGFIQARQGRFVRSADGQPLRFWAANGPPGNLRGDDLR